jgi:creatinine amidohydrolase
METKAERMRPHQIAECRKNADVAFLPLGSLEWHGVQNPIGTDSLKAHNICCRAAEILGGGAVFPPLYWGLPKDSFDVARVEDVAEVASKVYDAELERMNSPLDHGGMDIQEQWLHYQRLLRMCLEQIAAFGFKSIYICTGHNPLIHFAKPVAIVFTRVTRMAGVPVTVWFGGEFDAAGLTGDHGGKWETSHMMAVDEQLVDIAKISDNPAHKGVGAGIDALEATKEQGQAWVEECASAIAEEARWLADNYPELPPHHRHKRGNIK